MKKICKKIGRIFGIMGTFLFSICTKVFAEIPMNIIAKDIDPSVYGVPSIGSRLIKLILAFGKIFIIPVIILIGLFIYFKKKDNERYSKQIIIIKRLLIIISILFVAYMFYLIFNYL